MTVTKASIVNSVHIKLDISKSQASNIVEVLIEKIKGALSNGEDVLVTGFGKNGSGSDGRGLKELRNRERGFTGLLKNTALAY